MRRRVAALAGAAALLGLPAAAAPLAACHLEGVEHDARCGVLQRPLDPARPAAGSIEIHFAVLPALARRPLPDPVFFFAGGPGQSAIDLAAQVAALLARFSNRRDIVLVDQRGTGRSAPLDCGDDAPGEPLARSLDPARLVATMRACRERLGRLAWGDLRQFTTSIAVQDFDAVRARLGAERIDLVGVSYGTRVALEYLRQFPGHVRRVVLDGVVPPSLVLPDSGSIDAGSAFDALIAACAADAACRARDPDLGARWQALLATLPRPVVLHQPLTGAAEPLVLTREMLLGLVRAPLYVPALASALP
ncbi:MAG: alpha/beta fold hydrolase, partial [Burkholderiales bacterium]|nr:alpha/beta fold hydrolase [Burkholderiales bacterium]